MMTDPEKEKVLTNAKWKKQAGDGGSVWWEAPVTLIGVPHYFGLAEAFEMEDSGRIYDYSVDALKGKMLHEDDFRRMNEI
jgi:hypothetical protein